MYAKLGWCGFNQFHVIYTAKILTVLTIVNLIPTQSRRSGKRADICNIWRSAEGVRGTKHAIRRRIDQKMTILMKQPRRWLKCSNFSFMVCTRFAARNKWFVPDK